MSAKIGWVAALALVAGAVATYLYVLWALAQAVAALLIAVQ